MDRNGLAGDHRGAMRITLFILAVLLAIGARAQIQQNHFTTNKVSSGTGLTNVFTGTNALGARIYQLRMDVAAGPGVTLSTNGSQITFTAAGAGLGDVTGPTGATNLAIPIFDGASGKLLRDGGMTLSDLSAAGHTHAQLHDRGHGVTSASDHTDWPAGLDLTELGYVNGVTSGIQAQIDARQPASANLTNWSAMATGSKQDADVDLLQLATITWASGDVLYRTADSLTNLAKGIDGKVLKLVGGFPSWETDATGVGATGDDVWVNHADVTNPNLTNSATININVDGTGTNVSFTLVNIYQPADAHLYEWAGQGTNSVSLGTVTIGTTNVVQALAGKQAAGSYQPADPQLDEWATVSTNIVPALGVGALTATSVDIGVTNVVAALAGKQASGSYQAADAQLDEWAAQTTNGVYVQALTIGTTNVVAALADKQPLDADLTSWAGVTRAAGFDTFTATPSSANLRGAVTDENGTGAMLFDGASSLALGSSSFTAITNSALTAGRVIFSGTTKEQADDADLTFATDTLTATKVSAPTAVYAAALTVTNTATLATVAGAVDAGGATSLEIPNSDDPDVDAAGELSWDTDGWLRAYDGSNQVAVGRKLYQIDATVYKPNDLDDAQRDGVWIWSNQSGMSFVVTGWAAQSSSDDTDLNIEEIDADGQNNTTVDAVSITTNGTGIYYASDTTITAATIETGHILVLDFDDTDTPSQVHITIYGYFDANVN